MSAIQGDTSANPFRQRGLGVIAQGRDLVRRLAADRAQLRRILMIGGVALVALGALASWLMGGRYVSTDDAYVQAAKLMVSTDVSGLVQDVDVKEGQVVKTGDVLFRLDSRPFRIALANAVATRDQTALTIDSMKQDYKRMQSDISAQKAQVDLAQRNFDRDVRLLKAGAVSQSDYDTARATLSAARDQLQALKDTAATQLAKLGGSIDIPTHQLPQYLQAQSQVEEAQRQLNHSVVRAPFNGVVSEVDSLQPGTLVISAMSAFSTTSAVGLVATGNEWIEANMKETDLTQVKVGEPASFTVDTFPGRTWHGHVQAISAGTGSAFSVLPAENASGNWVKVVQRIRVKIAIDRKPGDPVLRSGMSTIVDIDTGHRRWYRMLFGR